ncbi:hypothetical protein [Streptomyces venezuelae]|uniref:hypothetical protein n=1 Tax=Streptomyces venezuelae TaxID=54571 RepID=UPI003796A9E1
MNRHPESARRHDRARRKVVKAMSLRRLTTALMIRCCAVTVTEAVRYLIDRILDHA